MTTRITQVPWFKVGLLILSGASLPLAFAPYGVWPCVLVSSAIFYYLLRCCSAKSGLLSAFLFGLGLFGHGASWVYVSIHDFGFTGMPLAVLLTALFVVFLAFVFSLPFYIYGKLKTEDALLSAVLFSVIWVLGEWLRSWLFTGFPWLFIGYAHIDSPLASFAPLGGVFLLSFISLLISCLLLNIASAIYKKVKKTNESCNEHHEQHLHGKNRKTFSSTAIQITIVAISLASAFALAPLNWTTSRAEPQSVSLIQPNVALIRKWDPYFFPGIMDELDEAANEHWQSDIQLWPEAAIPSLYHDMQLYIDDVQSRAEASNTNVISGVLYDNQAPFEVYNSIIGMGSASGVYFKQKLVPFGEYVPLEDYLRGIIAFFDLPNSVIRRGPYRPNAISAKTLSDYSYTVAPFICYEVVYPDFVAANSAQADLLVTISNDAWFGNSIGPHQHLEMVRMRALENQKYFARSTNTGISAIIDHKGNITASGQQFVKDVVTGTVELRSGKTPFVILGSYPIILFCFAVCILSYLLKRRGSG